MTANSSSLKQSAVSCTGRRDNFAQIHQSLKGSLKRTCARWASSKYSVIFRDSGGSGTVSSAALSRARASDPHRVSNTTKAVPGQSRQLVQHISDRCLFLHSTCCCIDRAPRFLFPIVFAGRSSPLQCNTVRPGARSRRRGACNPPELQLRLRPAQ